jgi:hypothetical protein
MRRPLVEHSVLKLLDRLVLLHLVLFLVAAHGRGVNVLLLLVHLGPKMQRGYKLNFVQGFHQIFAVMFKQLLFYSHSRKSFSAVPPACLGRRAGDSRTGRECS